MHVRGLPGSHVLLRVPAGKLEGDVDVQFAANLAAYFSKGRNETKIAVTTTKAANVKKPKGAKPGQVMVLKDSSVMARPGDCEAAQQGES